MKTKKKWSENSRPPLENNRAEKLKGNDLKHEAYLQYCAHISSGEPKQSFVFNHPELKVTWKTIEHLIKEINDEAVFPTFLMEEAKSKRYGVWMNEGKTLMKGGYKGGSPVIWQTIMRNMFRDVGWDQEYRDMISSPDLKAAFDVVRAVRDKPKVSE